jgi:hypothetical protein
MTQPNRAELIARVESAGREQLGEMIYRALYEHQGGQWSANETKGVWFDAADRLTALISAAKAHLGDDHGSGGAGWRPIETAPKDGTVIDLWAKRRVANARFDQTSLFGRGAWKIPSDRRSRVTCFAVLVDLKPTHWMPLPPAPDAAAPTAPPPADGRVEEQTDSSVARSPSGSLASPSLEGGCEPSTADHYPSHEALSQLVHLQDEYDALNGGGPNWLARWNVAIAEARDLVRVEP